MSTIMSPCRTSTALQRYGTFAQDRDFGDEADCPSEQRYAPPAKSLATRAARPEFAGRVQQLGFTQDRDTGDEMAHAL